MCGNLPAAASAFSSTLPHPVKASGVDVRIHMLLYRPMIKDSLIVVRCTPVEYRAVKRFAKAQGKTVADIIRGRVINPALSHDPKQREFAIEKEIPMRAG